MQEIPPKNHTEKYEDLFFQLLAVLLSSEMGLAGHLDVGPQGLTQTSEWDCRGGQQEPRFVHVLGSL